MTDAIVVLITAANDEAARIAETIVGERLGACVNIVAGIRSVYRWQGNVCKDEEVLLIVKTERRHFDALERRVRELHSYDLPEVIALAIEQGSVPYLHWINAQVGGE